MQLTETQLTENVNIVERLIDGLQQPRRELVKKMFEGQVGVSYFTSPASSRDNFHSCFPGGLMVHSLNVVRNLKTLTMALCPGEFDNSTIAFVGLFHDLGKTGDGTNDFYVPNPSDWHRKQGMLYEVNKKCLDMPNSERGLFILQNHGITLTQDEYLSIRLNDGMYAEENRAYARCSSKLPLLVHWADMWSTQLEKDPAQ